MAATVEEAYVYIAGREVGCLRKDVGLDLAFEYVDGYDGIPLSVGMPTGVRRFDGPRVTNWFKGLLPGSEPVLKALARQADCPPYDTFSLVLEKGADLPGAVQVLPYHSDEVVSRGGHYVRVSKEEIGQRLREIVQAERDGRSHAWASPGEHWSLSGNQGKISLRKASDGSWLRCLDGASSNYIIKPGVSWLSRQALVEALCMRAMRYVNIRTAEVNVEDFAGLQAIAIERYDRVAVGDEVIRIHQEDLCQALGKDPDRKYADEGGPTSEVMADLIGKVCPRDDVWDFAEYLLVNHLLSATDGHSKNYSLLMGPTGIRLAPQYDLASNVPYIDRSRYQPYKTALSIGGENRIGKLRETNLRKCARQFGLDEGRLFDRALELCETLPAALDHAALDLHDAVGIDSVAKVLVPKVACLCQDVSANLVAPNYTNSRPRYFDYVDDSYAVGSYQPATVDAMPWVAPPVLPFDMAREEARRAVGNSAASAGSILRPGDIGHAR